MKITREFDTDGIYFYQLDQGATFKFNPDSADNELLMKIEPIHDIDGSLHNAVYVLNGRTALFRDYDAVYKVRSKVIIGE